MRSLRRRLFVVAYLPPDDGEKELIPSLLGTGLYQPGKTEIVIQKVFARGRKTITKKYEEARERREEGTKGSFNKGLLRGSSRLKDPGRMGIKRILGDLCIPVTSIERKLSV